MADEQTGAENAYIDDLKQRISLLENERRGLLGLIRARLEETIVPSAPLRMLELVDLVCRRLTDLDTQLAWQAGEKHGAQKDAEQQKNIADGLRLELEQTRKRLEEHPVHEACPQCLANKRWLERRINRLRSALAPFVKYINVRLSALGDSHPAAYTGWLVDDGKQCAQLLREDWDRARIAFNAPAGAPAPELEYRCLWEECMGSIDGPLWVPFSGRVTDFQSAAIEQANRRKNSKFRNVTIECRVKQNAAWPRPCDVEAEEEPEPPIQSGEISESTARQS
jgi:hypothetical protein